MNESIYPICIKLNKGNMKWFWILTVLNLFLLCILPIQFSFGYIRLYQTMLMADRGQNFSICDAMLVGLQQHGAASWLRPWKCIGCKWRRIGRFGEPCRWSMSTSERLPADVIDYAKFSWQSSPGHVTHQETPVVSSRWWPIWRSCREKDFLGLVFGQTLHRKTSSWSIVIKSSLHKSLYRVTSWIRDLTERMTAK